MESATADPSLLTDTVTSDTTGSVGTVVSEGLDLVGTVADDEVVDVFFVSVVTGSDVVVTVCSVWPVLVDFVGAAMVCEQNDFLIFLAYQLTHLG